METTHLPRIDFKDNFTVTNHIDSLSDIAKSIFGTGPKWIVQLLKLRNKIVGPLGLKTGEAPDLTKDLKVGSTLGLFKVFQISDEQIIMGEDDNHLNFRVQISNKGTAENNIHVTTTVEINNWLGKIYFTFIRPIHPIVVKSLLKNVDKPKVVSA
ncbi:DUF2867 domain-containing protein [Reichenbachiella ulvae]|uniref:DUF2867 domain-containing protein n=1 Tax=Reichenbachiella ulvae TaxID=2980104 RepID=A0ABT3CYF1_9BACT|nr:DUF2867 domain-containing protein [Reichenbachiella ulvae]MCV9388730.1 DUF2867 domain-containing protein [Reichenbachiella ulvae]